MKRIKRYSFIIMAMLICVSMTLLTGCHFSSTHESEIKLNINVGEESETEETKADTPMRQAAASIYDYLQEDWPDSFYVSYTDDDGSEDANTVYVLFWKNGAQSIDNIDEIIGYMNEYSETFSGMMEDAGVTDGHLELEVLVDVKDDDSYLDGTCVLEVADGEIVHNAYE